MNDDDPRLVTDHDRSRLRLARRIALGGVGAGALAAAILGVLGASGAAGAAVLFVLTAAGCIAASLGTGVLAIVDEARRRPVARRRIFVAIGYFVAAAAALVASVGAAASATGG